MEPMDDKDLRKLARDAAEGRVFFASQVAEQDVVSMVFMPLLFLSKEDAAKMEQEGVIDVYQYLDQAGPRCINGYPIFMSMCTITKPDKDKLIQYVDEYNRFQKAFADVTSGEAVSPVDSSPPDVVES